MNSEFFTFNIVKLIKLNFFLHSSSHMEALLSFPTLDRRAACSSEDAKSALTLLTKCVDFISLVVLV